MKLNRLSAMLLVVGCCHHVHATVPTSVRSVSYHCNGTTTGYTVTFPFLASTDLVATYTPEGASSPVVTLALGADYAVTGAGGSSGTLTLTTGAKCPNLHLLTIKRVVPVTQPATFVSKVIEHAFDRATMVSQQISSRQDTVESRQSSVETTQAAMTAELTSDTSRIGLLETTGVPGPWVWSSYAPGKPGAGARIFKAVAVRPVTLTAGLVDSAAQADTAPTTNAVLPIILTPAAGGPVQIGTLNFSAGNSTGSFSFSSSQAVAPLDCISITAPATQDATLAGIAVTFLGTR